MKMKPLKPVMTEREKVLEAELKSIVSQCENCIYNGARFDITKVMESAKKALNFQYGATTAPQEKEKV